MRTRTGLILAVFFGLVGCESAPPPAAPEPPPPAPPIAIAPPPVASTEPAKALTPEEEKFAKVVIKVTKVAGTVYMLEGEGGNIGVSVGDDGIVIVDDEFAPLAPKIKEALKNITDKPIRVVLNTHWHGDHTGGNAAFSSAPIVAHENVRNRLLAGAPAREIGGKMRDPIPPAPPAALPIITFRDRVSVHLNGEDIRAIHLPSGHTDGDVVILFTKSNVVHMGDDFVTYGFPFVDLDSGGSVRGLAAALDTIVKELPPDVKVIPGHGRLSTIDDVKKLAAVLKDCVKLVDAEVKKKKTLEQIQADKPLAKYDDMGKDFMKADGFVAILFKELTAKPAPAKAAPTK